MKGIGYQNTTVPENRKKFNDIEQTKELDLNQYDAFYRTMDPQTCRWWQIDPKVDDGYESVSPYSSMYDDPILVNDPLGDEGEDCCKVLWSLAGAAAAAIDDATGINLRSTLAPSRKDKEALRYYNDGQNGGDAAMVLVGAGETWVGGGMATGGAAAATTGVGTVPGGIVAGGGIVLGAHGAFTATRAASNLATQKGRVEANSTGSGTFGGKQSTESKTAKEAFGKAKEQNGVPKSQQPEKQYKTTDKNTGKQLRTYDFKNSDGKKVTIRRDNPIKYKDGGAQGKHYNAGTTGEKLKQHHNYEN